MFEAARISGLSTARDGYMLVTCEAAVFKPEARRVGRSLLFGCLQTVPVEVGYGRR
jgi:hypothetical protein